MNGFAVYLKHCKSTILQFKKIEHSGKICYMQLLSSLEGLDRWSSCVCAKLFQSCPILCDPMDCSLPGSSVHGILQSRLLEWFPCLLAGEYSLPRNEPRSPALAGGFFTTSTTWKTQIILGVPKAHCPYTSCNVTAHFFVHLPSHTVSTMRPGGTSYSNF